MECGGDGCSLERNEREEWLKREKMKGEMSGGVYDEEQGTKGGG